MFCMKLWDRKYLKLREPNLLRKSSLDQKCAKMAQIICLPITTAFFSGFPWQNQTSWEKSCPKMGQNYIKWLNLSVTTFVHCGSIFSWVWLIRFVLYFAWSWGTLSIELRESSFLRKFLIAWKWVKMTQTSMICLFVDYGNNFSWDWLIRLSDILYKVKKTYKYLTL